MKLLALAVTVLLASSLAAFSAQDQPGKDGEYRDPYSGEPQPAMCDNSFKNPKPCECARTEKEKCDGRPQEPGLMCKTRCRPKACGCVGACTS